MRENLSGSVAPLTCLGISLRPLNPKQRKFVINLFENGFDVTKAATSAGYRHPKVRGPQLLKHPQINRIIEAIQRKIGRETDLNLKNVLQELSRAVFRDIRDLYDEHGNLLPAKDLPDHIGPVVDSVQEKERYDKTGNLISKTNEYKMIPKASALDMALKVTGAYAPEKHEHAMTIDWDTLLEAPAGADSVDKEVEAIEDQSIEGEFTVEED